ncbi:eukaryotic sulfide quinone oxidoreductase [Malassezia yamatoensis]|uniref:Eukaryotic sulfide quinone oxidoreductase n=1 Tax=Malassezia yamatoensis TaxID=253288 RepID=A0AAJ5YW87_9BASI|nr:eukaryotic sulfide quinone oxidoreductase [Malassezia yamatoensis]
MISLAARQVASKGAVSARLFSTTIRVQDAAHKVVVVGGGTAGLTVSHELLRSGQFQPNEIAILDPSRWHDYQPGWSLVGGGLARREDLRREEASLVDPKIKLYQQRVTTFSPDANQVSTESGEKFTYDQLIVAPGYQIKLDAIPGLPEALEDPNSKVSSIYTYDTTDKVYAKIKDLRSGRAIFTQPGSPIKCAGAPQKIMWLALDTWKQNNLFKPHDPDSPIKIDFATGMPTMFSVPKYSEVLNQLREERGVGGLFKHDLVAIEDQGNTAVFSVPEGDNVKIPFDFLHVTPRMVPPEFIKNSPLSNDAGYIDVNPATLQQVKYKNVWALGDASSLPTSKTAAAITGQAPILTHNLLQVLNQKQPDAEYNGYTSCPLLTEYGKVLLAEFKYELKPDETFSQFGLDQGKPQRAFYYLKKNFFPWVYFNSMLKGTWNGRSGFQFGTRSYSTHAMNRSRMFSTSCVAQRNTPARRPRDPLDSANVTRFPLASGETFLKRTPASQPSHRTSLQSAEQLFDSAQSIHETQQATLPPKLRMRHRQARDAHAILSEDQIKEIQSLRAQDPYQNTAGVLAKKFGCSPTFVSIVAPASKQVRKAREAETKLKKATWGVHKRIASMERHERRLLW